MKYALCTLITMALSVTSTLCFTAHATAEESNEQIDIIRRGSSLSLPGDEQRYTGSVRIDQRFTAENPARLVGESVTFEPKSRSAWQTNPMGQTVLITSGKALIQAENGSIETALPGDVVYFPPKLKHWFGAAPNIGMTAMILAEAVNGSTVNWQEKVSDEHYVDDASTANKKTGQITISRAGSLSSTKADPAHFTGAARVDALFSPQNGSHAYGAMVTFEPCARTDWHSHSMGQTLIITSGRGYVQELGGPRHELYQGDIAWTPADIMHWHGAAPDTAMTHMALSERAEGKSVTWGKRLTDQEYGALNPKEMPPRLQKIALIAAFTASGDIDRLKTVLIEGLETGLTVNEIKEVLIHTYAYAGFPRSLNATNAFITVMDEREEAGISDVQGPEASVRAMEKSRYQYGYDVLAKLRNPHYVPGKNTGDTSAPQPRYETFLPTIEIFLKEHLFADIFTRDVLDYQSREMATLGVLSNLPGTNAQFRSHIDLAIIQGVSDEQMRHLFNVMGNYLGRERADNALAVLNEVTAKRKK